jgi:PKD repeat protein
LSRVAYRFFLVGVLSVTLFSSGIIMFFSPPVPNQLSSTTSSAFATFPGENGKIAFDRDRVIDSTHEIYVMNADGSEQTRLTNNDLYVLDQSPDWSPDGTKIAFDSSRESGRDIYVMNAADGSDVTRLTSGGGADDLPSWSPDGTKIAFRSYREYPPQIYTMNADGSEQTNVSNNTAFNSNPDFGSGIATEPPADTTPPVLTVPEDMVVEAISSDGAEVTYNVTAEDNVDGIATLEEDGALTQDNVGGGIDISCDPPSGSTFPVGDTEVQCTATDEAGNVGGPVSFTVTVNPPPPDPLTAEIRSNATEGTAPATFEFRANVTGGTEPYQYSWDFGDDSGSEGSDEETVVHTYDEPGTYNVTLTVTDANEQQQTDTLQVTVNERPPSPPPPFPTIATEVIDELISNIESLEDLPQGTKTGIVSLLERVSALLSDDSTRNDASACIALGAFIDRVDNHERRDTLTPEQSDELRTQAQNIMSPLACYDTRQNADVERNNEIEQTIPEQDPAADDDEDQGVSAAEDEE